MFATIKSLNIIWICFFWLLVFSFILYAVDNVWFLFILINPPIILTKEILSLGNLHQVKVNTILNGKLSLF